MTINPTAARANCQGQWPTTNLSLLCTKVNTMNARPIRLRRNTFSHRGMPVTYLLQASPAANNRALSSIKATQYHEDFAFFAIVVLSFHITARYRAL